MDRAKEFASQRFIRNGVLPGMCHTMGQGSYYVVTTGMEACVGELAPRPA